MRFTDNHVERISETQVQTFLKNVQMYSIAFPDFFQDSPVYPPKQDHNSVNTSVHFLRIYYL